MLRRFLLAALSGLALLARPGSARAEDGGNAACPAHSADADDVREQYDAHGRLVHQLRLQHGQDVEEVALAYRNGHAIARTEAVAGHLRIARTSFDDDKVKHAECYVDGQLTGEASYRYVGDHVVEVEKRELSPNAASPDATVTQPPTWSSQTTHYFYDVDGQLIASEVRAPDGRRLSITHLERAAASVPVLLAFTAGGTYQSETQLYDASAGLGIHRRPQIQRYGSDPLEVGLDGVFKFHRAAGVTSTDQTTLRFSADYHDILPRTTLFTFTSTDRNLPANLRLNLEEGVLGVKFDIVPRRQYQLDVSFAPVWNFRSIVSPTTTAAGTTLVQENTSKLRGSFRARAGLHLPTWSLLDTFEFLPTLFGDDVAQENGFWNRTVVRDTVDLDISLSKHLSFHEELKYTRDPAMRAQASCPDASNPLCRGYAVDSTTAIVLNLEL